MQATPSSSGSQRDVQPVWQANAAAEPATKPLVNQEHGTNHECAEDGKPQVSTKFQTDDSTTAAPAQKLEEVQAGLSLATGSRKSEATVVWRRRPLNADQLHALLSLAAFVRAVPKPPANEHVAKTIHASADEGPDQRQLLLQYHRPYQTVLRLLAAQACVKRHGAFTFPQLKALQLQLQAQRYLRLAEAAARAATAAGRHPRAVFRRTGAVLPAVLRRAMVTGLICGRFPDGTRMPSTEECLQVMTEIEQQCQSEFPKWEELYAAEAALASSEAQYTEQVCAQCSGERWLPVGKVMNAQGVELSRPPPLDPILVCRERDREVHHRLNEARRALDTILHALESEFRAAYTQDAAPIPEHLMRTYVHVRIRHAMLRLLRLQQRIRERILEAGTEARGSNASSHGRLSNKRIRCELARYEREERRAREADEREQRRHTLSMWRAVEEYATSFRAFFREEKTRNRLRLNREIHRFFEERERSDQRREREEERRRIQALRENNEEAYRALVQNTKNERLKLILEQTDDYLRQLGAIVSENRSVLTDRAADAADPASSLSLSLSSSNMAGQRAADSYYELAHRVRERVLNQSSLLTGGELKHYQLVGVEWLLSLYNNRLNGVLADEMGLGKTVQTIALLCHLIEFKQDEGPFLIVVPLSTVSNWESELAHWAPSLKVSVFKGDRTARRRLANELFVRDASGRFPFHILLTTYEYALRARAALSKIIWSYIIVDEGHRIKNAASKLAQVLGQKYRSRNRLLLTGTPLHNSLSELWSLLNFLLPQIFSSCDTFEAWFNAPFATMPGEHLELTEEESLLIINRLHKVLRPFLLRRLKNEILRGGEKLPEKREVLFLCDMSAWQRLVYRQLIRHERVVFTDKSGRRRHDRLSNSKMQLRKIVNHPYLFHPEYEKGGVNELVRASGKFQILDSCIQKLLRTGHRVLIFNQMTRIMDLQERLLRARNIPFLRLQGLTTADERRELVQEFNRPGTKYNVFLLTTRAGGLGVNLQTADTVILFDSDWNPQMDIQAQDRAHRIGQKKAVRVLRIVTARSVEQHVLDKAELKLDLEQKIIRAGMFHQEAKDSDREAFLRHLIRESAMNEVEEEEDEDDGDDGDAAANPGRRRGARIHTLEEINRLLARSDEEYEIFCQIDREYLARLWGVDSHDPILQDLSQYYPPLLEEHEIPDFVRNPEKHGYRRGQDDMLAAWALELEADLAQRLEQRDDAGSSAPGGRRRHRASAKRQRVHEAMQRASRKAPQSSEMKPPASSASSSSTSAASASSVEEDSEAQRRVAADLDEDTEIDDESDDEENAPQSAITSDESALEDDDDDDDDDEDAWSAS